jgi:hypothetical protein
VKEAEIYARNQKKFIKSEKKRREREVESIAGWLLERNRSSVLDQHLHYFSVRSLWLKSNKPLN